jgi:MFS transporter, putative metabolite transport protein
LREYESKNSNLGASVSTVQSVSFDDVPLRPFHVRIATAGAAGQFSDGYILGIVGISSTVAAPQLGLNSLWLGLVGAASLAGLFFGCLIGGATMDRLGRRFVITWDMLPFALLSALQFFVQDAVQLLAIRVALGLILGLDYVAGKAFVSEFMPKKSRGTMMSVLALAWAAGYVGAYVIGYEMRSLGPDSWRWMLASSAIPALLGLAFRVGIPESPRWLVRQNRHSDARAIVTARLGDDVALPESVIASEKLSRPYSTLFSAQWRRRTFVGCIFYMCHMLPYFCLSTYAPRVMSALNVSNGFTAGLIYNILILLGAVVGMFIIDRLSRRSFLVWGFLIQAALLAPLVVLDSVQPIAVVTLFAAFGCLLSASDNLGYVYPPELFATELRAAGIGLAVAASRISAAVSTFALPIVVSQYGVKFALGICAVTLLFGAIVCQIWAPETAKVNLADASCDSEQDEPTSARLRADGRL